MNIYRNLVKNYNWNVLNKINRIKLFNNVSKRKTNKIITKDFDKIMSVYDNILHKVGPMAIINHFNKKIDEFNHTNIENEEILFLSNLRKFPNMTSNTSKSENVLLKHVNCSKSYENPQSKDTVDIGKTLKIIKLGPKLTYSYGERAYILEGHAALLHKAIIMHIVDVLRNKGFLFLSVSDIVEESLVAGCGFNVNTDTTQVYKILNQKFQNMCLSGTGEIGIANYLKGQKFKKSQLPLKFATVSKCYRSEISPLKSESGLYRVHDFSKVEMFGITENSIEKSNLVFQEFLNIQNEIFSNFCSNYRILEMGTKELGNPAFRKIDIEAYLPSRKNFGEISSLSNCTDYQSVRLGINYTDNEDESPVHTINGTAGALTRLIMVILENNQVNNKVKIPKVLEKYMGSSYLQMNRIAKQIHLLPSKVYKTKLNVV
ncbi:Serine--tRNA ligase, mitochondrial [Intoshia linei]|uniref:serine--tRNA ligase n=1 Tax=Intoshia linei TaxID=1819745 RepID=A0A177B4L8_9BILA|nr:Serine--tRNA ligase, mitochondrial [Intoshia linei]